MSGKRSRALAVANHADAFSDESVYVSCPRIVGRETEIRLLTGVD